jgi:dihydrophenazinedicarboxylate synthase
MAEYEVATVAVRDASIFASPASEPMQIIQAWFDEARHLHIPECSAMALATSDAEGRSSARMVHVIEVGHDALVFTTHRHSQKGREIDATGWSSGVVYWRETKQQIIVAGPTKPMSADVCDVLWARRPVSTNAMSVVSKQSLPLDDEAALRARANELMTASTLPRPEGWVGYAIHPETVEFWHASPDRLHQRLRYDRGANGWTWRRLQP